MADKGSRKSLLINGLLCVLAFGLLGWTVWSNRAKIAEVRARNPDFRLIAAALSVYVTALVVTFARWHRLVMALELPFRFRDAIRLGFIGNVFNLVIPGAVGGDVIKAAFLCREQERKTQAVASMVIDRILGLLGLFVLAGVVGAFAWSEASPDVRKLIAFAWFMIAGGVVGLAVLFTPALYGPLLRLLAGRGKLEIIARELVTMASAYGKRLDVIALALGLAVVGHSLFVISFYLTNRALFGPEAPTILQHYLVLPLVFFSTAIPMPFGALGVTEQVSKSLFLNLVGFPSGDLSMLGYRVIMYTGGLISVIVYLANLEQVRQLKQEPAVTGEVLG